MNGERIPVVVTGVTVTSTGTAVSQAIPTNNAGKTPLVIRVTASAVAHIRLGYTCTTDDLMVQPGDAVNLYCAGFTAFTVISNSGTAKVTVTPVEIGNNLFTEDSPWTPLSLFREREAGAWFDASDMTSMFQDSAGTTPVTALEQPVGRWLDKSGRGNHASQATAASRPVLSARYNLLTETEFRNGVTDAPVRGGLISATTMSGYAGAIAFGHDGSTNGYAYKAPTFSASTPYTLSVVVQMDDGAAPTFGNASETAATNDFALVMAGVILIPTTYTVSSLGSNIYRVTGQGTTSGTPGANTGVTKYATNSNRTFKVTAYDLRLSTDAALSIPSYQRVNTSTDYDSTGFPLYLKFDGVDDSLATGSINFTSTDKVTVWAGVHKSSDAARGMVVEHGTDPSTQTRIFHIDAAPNTSGTYGSYLSVDAANNSRFFFSTYAAPISNVLAAQFDQAATTSPLRVKMRVNGVVNAGSDQSLGSTTAGTFGSYPLYIGRRGGSTLPFNGRLTQLVVRGAATTDVTPTERYIASKTGVVLS